MADHIIDAKNKRLGRLASKIATVLQGKHMPVYDPKDVGSDRVIIKNVSGILISGNKKTDKVYYKHTGPLGHLKKTVYGDVFEKDPAFVLRHAVRLMLPKNRLLKVRMKKLIIEK